MESRYFKTLWSGLVLTARNPGTFAFIICLSIAIQSLFGAPPAVANAAIDKTILICNTQARNNDATCASYSQYNLVNRATPLLFAPTPCDNGQLGLECDVGANQAISEVRYLVIDAGNASSTLYSLTRNASGTGVVSQVLPLGSEEVQLEESILDLEAIYEQLPEALTFHINLDGTVTNGLGQRVSSFETPNTNNASLQSAGDGSVIVGKLAQECPSALAFAISLTCSNTLGEILHDFNETEDSNLRDMLESISGISVQVQALVWSISVTLSDTEEAQFLFADGSVLVLDLELGNRLGISLKASKSQISGGSPLSSYLDGKDNDNIHGGAGPVSGGEAKAIFDSHFECQSMANIIGYNKNYLVTRVTYPDGSSKITAIQYEGSTAIYGAPHIVCN